MTCLVLARSHARKWAEWGALTATWNAPWALPGVAGRTYGGLPLSVCACSPVRAAFRGPRKSLFASLSWVYAVIGESRPGSRGDKGWRQAPP